MKSSPWKSRQNATLTATLTTSKLAGHERHSRWNHGERLAAALLIEGQPFDMTDVDKTIAATSNDPLRTAPQGSGASYENDNDQSNNPKTKLESNHRNDSFDNEKNEPRQPTGSPRHGVLWENEDDIIM